MRSTTARGYGYRQQQLRERCRSRLAGCGAPGAAVLGSTAVRAFPLSDVQATLGHSQGDPEAR